MLAGYGSHQRVSEGHRGGMQASYGSHQRVSEGEGGHRGAILTNSHRVWVLKEPPVPLGADPALTPSEGHQHGTPQPVGQP